MKKIISVIITFVLLSAALSLSAVEAKQEQGFREGTESSVTFSWEADPDADFYYIYKYNPTTEKYELYRSSRVNEITAPELISGKVYYFKVMPVKIENGRRVPLSVSEKITCVTSPQGRLSISTEDIGNNYISLSWNKISRASGYRVYLYDSEKDDYRYLKSTKENKATVKKLKKDTEYKFIIEPYKSKNGSVAYGEKSEPYPEYTFTDGVPHTAAQLAKAYNSLVNSAKSTRNMTVKYSKEIDTEMISCSRENLALTVKNTANLYKGVLNKKYTFNGGKSGNITPDMLFEPYGKKANVRSGDIEYFTAEKTKQGYKASFTVKRDNGTRKNGSYYNGLLSLKNPMALDTSPLKIRSADTYYDSARVSFTVKDKKLKSLSVQGSVLADINFEVAKTVADTTVGYALIEEYKITY